MKIFESFKEILLKENKEPNDDFYIIYEKDRFVSHITSLTNANNIKKAGFKTGFELGVSEKRKAVYFADRDVNYGLYARTQQGEAFEGDEIGEVVINLKGLKLLNMAFKENNTYITHKKYNLFVVRGELEKIPYDIDGTISFLEDGRIYEVALPKDIATKSIIKNKR